MRVNWNFIKGFILLGLVGFLYGFSHYKHSNQKVNEIVVEFEGENNLFMNYEMVNKLLIQNNQTVKNQAKSVIDLHKLEKNVLAHPMVQDASISVTIDGLLKATIKQRNPVARVVTPKESYYIDSQAMYMPLSQNYTARVLMIFGNIEQSEIDTLFKIVTTIQANEFLSKQVTGITKEANGEYSLTNRIGNQKVLLGKANEITQKCNKLDAFFKKAMKDNTLENYSVINLKYNNQVVCTKR